MQQLMSNSYTYGRETVMCLLGILRVYGTGILSVVWLGITPHVLAPETLRDSRVFRDSRTIGSVYVICQNSLLDDSDSTMKVTSILSAAYTAFPAFPQDYAAYATTHNAHRHRQRTGACT